MNILQSEGITFKEIERNFYEIGCEVARTLMEKFLEEVDQELAESRNKAELRHKGKKATTVKTLMGEVPINRVIYKRIKEDGRTEHVHLLDEALGMETIGLVSPNLVEKILDHICEMSYREVSQAVTEFTNQTISPQGVWDIVQAVGEKQEEAEQGLVKAYENQQLSGDREVPIIFEEADGLWLSMQRKDRKKGASKGKKELKIGVVYEGWKKRYPSSKEYKTIGKMAFAGYMKPEDFKAVRDAAIANKYNVDEIIYRVLNGDGATWIKNGHDCETDIFQLDPYHLSKSVIKNVYDKQARRHIMRWLKEGELEKVFSKIEKLKYECGGTEKEVNKLTELENYIKNNIDGVIKYKDKIDIPKATGEVEYRTLGTAESDVGVFAKRMKGRKSWSINGANNLSKIIALKMEKGFKDKIAALVSGKLSERVTERFEETLYNRNELKEAARKKLYPIHHGQIPFLNSKVTNGRKAIRKMFDMRSFNDMVYR